MTGAAIGQAVPRRPDVPRRAWRVTLRTPAMLVVAMVLIISVPLAISVGGTEFGPADLLSAVLVVVLGIVAVRDGLQLDRTIATLVAAIVVAASVVAVSGTDVTASIAGWLRYLQLFALAPVAVVLAVRRRGDAELVVHAIIAVALLQAVVCTVQFATGTGATYQGENNRGYGTFSSGEVIAASTIVGLGITACAGLMLAAGPRRRALYIVAIVVLFVGLLCTLSRGSLLNTGVAVVVVLLFAGWRVLLGTAVCGVAALTVLLGGFGLQNDIISDRIASISDGAPDTSTGDRYALWTAARDMWVDHPVVGVGLKAFPDFRDRYARLDLSSGSAVGHEGGSGAGVTQQELLSPHSQYLLVLSEQGLVGFLPFAALLIVATGTTARTTWRSVGPTRGLGAAVLGMSVWQLVQFVVGDVAGATSLITSVILGLGLWYGLDLRAGNAEAAFGGPHGERAAQE